MTSALRRIASATAGLALMAAPAGYGCDGGGGQTSAPASNVRTVSAATITLVADELTITSPAFADGAPIPVQYSCKGANVAPPLAWSAPAGAGDLALVVDDPDAVGGLYVHWIVTGIAPGSGSTADGQTPGNGRSLPNSGGQQGYFGPCPPAGTGTHHYRFTLYQIPAPCNCPRGPPGCTRRRR